jgi:NADP-dependent 3-hydroxy acid dehydrogenase YdfG
MNSLKGHVAIVTGAGRGIGRAISRTLASEGAAVVVAARSLTELEAVAQECRSAGVEALAVRTDITDPKEVQNLVGTTVRQFGRIDLLVNNAGIGFFKPVVALPLEEFDAMWNVNMRGVFLASREVLPFMEKAGSGCIINIGSLAGKNPVRDGAGYAATKWALRGFSSSLMLEVRDKNIRVVTIFPGSVDTSFRRTSGTGRNITKPEDVASAVVFAATFPARSMVSELDVRPTRP